MPGGTIEKRPLNLPAVPGVPARKRQSEAAVPRAFRSVRRNRHLSAPLAMPPAGWILGEIAHAQGWGPEALAAGAVATGFTWFFAPHKWTDDKGAPRRPEVWYARATAAGASGWLTAAAFLGPTPGADGAVLGPVLVALCAAWGVPWYLHKRPRGQKKRQRELSYWQNVWEHYTPDWNLRGSHVIEAEDKPSQVRVRVQLVGGRQTIATLRAAVPQIESALDGLTDIGMVRVKEVPGHPSQGDVFLKRENPLREVVEWDPSLAPASVHDLAVLGKTEAGEWATGPMRVNAFINGKTRSGKGNHLLLRAVQLSGCADGRQVVIDLKQRSARTLLRSGGLEYVITAVAEARAYLLMLRAETAARAREAATDEEQLLATVHTPAIHTLIDETNPLTSMTAGDSECARLLALNTAEGSGLEIYTEVYSQYGALDESVRTEQTRANLALRVCYATEAADHGSFALGDGHRFSGTAIDTSKLEEKGEFYMKLGPKARPERLRAPEMSFRQFEEIVSANAARLRRRPLHLYCGGEPSPVAGQTWQQWWDRRFLRIDPAFRRDSPQYAEAVEVFGEPADAATAPAPASRPVSAPALPPETGPSGAEVAAMIAAETSGADAAPTAETQAAAAGGRPARVRAFCDALTAGRISPAQLVKVSGLPRSTVMDYLRRLRDRGAVTQPEEGVYVVVHGRDVHAEMGAVRAGDDALLADVPALRLVQ
jgi:hypothetical protein